LNLIATKTTDAGGTGLQPTIPGSVTCPCCNHLVNGFYLFPMSLAELDRAVQLKKEAAMKAKKLDSSAVLNDNGKRDRSSVGDDVIEVQAETSYLLLSHTQGMSGGSVMSAEGDFWRTGRWTDEETQYVDCLVEAFDRGQLPVPNGVRLNDFLRDILLCKASRLTKKMKNAKLSSRSFDMQIELLPGHAMLNRQLLSSLQEAFLNSITQEPAKLELRFNVTKAWRSLFSNLCLQLGSNMLHANDWITSLEEMEARAREAEEMIRKARRRRMGMALKTDVKSSTAPDGVYFSGIPIPKHGTATSRSRLKSTGSNTSVSTNASDDGSQEDSLIASMLDLGAESPVGQTVDDIAMLFHDFDGTGGGDGHLSPTSSFLSKAGVRKNCGPFLEAIVLLMEQLDLPFQHVDVWVPSFPAASSSAGSANSTAASKSSEVRLYHAGHATRSDIDPVMYGLLHEYGEYSTRFSFASGAGLPGRVYESGKPMWERHLDDADPQFFKRAGGAKVYGVKTGFGLPMATTAIGRMVVSMYSTFDIEESLEVAKSCLTELAKFRPEPKWRLVVEMEAVGTDDNEVASVSFSNSATAPAGMDPPQIAASTFSVPPTSQIASNAGYRNDGSFAVPANGQAAHGRSMSLSTIGSIITVPTIDLLEEEQRIATLLGDHIPLEELPSDSGAKYSSMQGQNSGFVVPLFMSLRLLLLRSPSRRSDEDNEIIEVIRKSYRGYSRDHRRSEKDVAFLIVKDFHFLKSAQTAPVEDKKPASEQRDEYKSHVMYAPSVCTYSSTGMPQKMPPSLPFVDPSQIRKSSFDEQSRSRISPADEPEVAPYNVNIVGES